MGSQPPDRPPIVHPTMEFPELGVNCSVSHCNQLDFLPVKCDACKSKFCNDHFLYDAHSCPLKHTKDAQVPVCPLCDAPVPTAKGTSPDVSVSAHLDRDCREKAKRKTKNRCSVKKCKQTEVHEEARAVEREEQAPVGEGREPSPIKHRSAIELCKTKEQSLQKQKLNLQSQYTKNTNLLNFLLTS